MFNLYNYLFLKSKDSKSHTMATQTMTNGAVNGHGHGQEHHHVFSIGHDDYISPKAGMNGVNGHESYQPFKVGHSDYGSTKAGVNGVNGHSGHSGVNGHEHHHSFKLGHHDYISSNGCINGVNGQDSHHPFHVGHNDYSSTKAGIKGVNGHNSINGHNNHHPFNVGHENYNYDTAIRNSAWAHCNESSNDYRSDFFTKPSLPMLHAIISASLGDGDMGEDKTTRDFQEYVAGLIGHEAAILAMSASMGNQIALRTALKTPPHGTLSDSRGHILNWESGSAASLCGTMMKGIYPSNGHHLTLKDIKANAVVTETYYDAPTRMICLENTLGGTIMPLEDIRAISQWARAQNPPIHMHLDGARLWEAATTGACTLRDMGECFDSITLCLTKGLGAPIGSVVTGTAEFMKRANWARKQLGGSVRASGVIAGPGRVAIDDVFLGGKMKSAQDKAQRATALWQELGGKLTLPTETNMVWLDIAGSGLTQERYYEVASGYAINIGEPLHGRLCFHYQISDQAFEALCGFMRAVLRKPNTSTLPVRCTHCDCSLGR